ncbi:MAG: hypothetical protein BWX45_01275 [Deltaproteobacteria bacterium ADurb.Bin002]|nr:MAG: hypothetical protein BWX45_01275 [Deltaproteobacteria bacterium ADurb.Bin002]
MNHDDVAGQLNGPQAAGDGILALSASGNNGSHFGEIVFLHHLFPDGQNIITRDDHNDVGNRLHFLKHKKRAHQHRQSMEQKILLGHRSAHPFA